ncbi:MAG: hypothetical protein Kow0080_37190 [Candidatus Promineifilaceae bacterium]
MNDEPETIKVTEEELKQEEGSKGKRWQEEFVVASEELWETVKRLLHETAVRRIVIRNEAKRINVELPLAFGIAGIALLPAYTAVALIAALVTDCKILVERVGSDETA